VVAGAGEVSAGGCVWLEHAARESAIARQSKSALNFFILHSPIPLHCQEVFFHTYQADGNNYIPNPNAL
jgi:hypothetical protein